FDGAVGAAVGHSGTVLFTDNGGAWDSAPLGRLEAVCLTNGNTGWAAGSGILRTTDGGEHWTRQLTGLRPDPGYHGISCVSPDIATIVGNSGTILRTVDGGAHWTAQVSGTTGTLRAVSFANANIGTIVGESILHTVDGGLTWNRQFGGGGSGVYQLDAQRAVSVGNWVFLPATAAPTSTP